MSEKSPNRAPLATVLAVFALFALFFAVVYGVYLPRATGAFADDGIHTAAQRKKNLAELRAKQAQQLAGYGWVDRKAGTLQLPIDRAMALTLGHYAKH